MVKRGSDRCSHYEMKPRLCRRADGGHHLTAAGLLVGGVRRWAAS